jgi:hypothetical protein
VTTLLASVRRKLFGQTRAIPLGVAATMLLAYLARGLLRRGEWQTAGGFALAAAIIAAFVFSLPGDIRRPNNQHTATKPDPNTTTRTNR